MIVQKCSSPRSSSARGEHPGVMDANAVSRERGGNAVHVRVMSSPSERALSSLQARQSFPNPVDDNLAEGPKLTIR